MHKLLGKLFLLGALVLAVLAAAFAWVALSPIGMQREPVEFTVAPGSSLRAVTREIAAAGADLDPWLLLLLGKLMRVEASIKAGSYQVGQGVTPLDLLRKLSRGDVTQAELTFIEGWTFRQMRERLDAHPDLRHETVGLSEAEIMRLLGAPNDAAEGVFFPIRTSLPNAAATSICWPGPIARCGAIWRASGRPGRRGFPTVMPTRP